ncbi:MAG TPA: ATP-binding protein [Anaerolineales bacterium]|nr:ATP-binding protein [Anaerolineales bacterium]
MGIGIAIGLPVLLLINRQASSQAQLLLDQATLITRAFLASERADLQNLALLTSQRPTLIRLLQEQDVRSLESYLETLRTGAGLDLILVCADGQAVQGIGEGISVNELCQSSSQSGYTNHASGDDLYIYTAATLESLESPYKVVVGKRISVILRELQNETGLLYFLIQKNQVLRSSDPAIELPSALIADLQSQADQSENSSLAQRAFPLKDHQYISGVLVVDPALDIQLVNALNVDDQLAIQQGLNRTLIMALFLIILLGFGLGVWQAQRISRPIVELAEAASKFRHGNLESPVSIQSSVLEISQLANTLEDARVALQHSLEQIQAEKAWMEHLLNSIVEGTLTLDAQNRITFVSAGVSKIIEREPAQIIDHKVDEVFLATEGEVAFSQQLPSPGQQRRVSIKLANGQERLLSVSKANLIPPVASDANRALVIRDVTNEEYIHRLLGDFIANITHEFRTPLAALEASSELLLDNLHSLSQTETKDLLVSLNLGIINLQTLIDNLIEAASIEAGRFKVALQPVAFAGILSEAQEIMQPLIERYELRLVSTSPEESIFVMADRRRTVQILVNLLSNAIKHSPAKGLIRISHTIEADRLRVEVIDEGGGVPLEQRSNLFRRFSHLNTRAERAKQGLGLGLSVVKAIVEAQQGEVGIADQPGGGNCFWFTLPLGNGSSA